MWRSDEGVAPYRGDWQPEHPAKPKPESLVRLPPGSLRADTLADNPHRHADAEGGVEDPQDGEQEGPAHRK